MIETTVNVTVDGGSQKFVGGTTIGKRGRVVVRSTRVRCTDVTGTLTTKVLPIVVTSGDCSGIKVDCETADITVATDVVVTGILVLTMEVEVTGKMEVL